MLWWHRCMSILLSNYQIGIKMFNEILVTLRSNRTWRSSYLKSMARCAHLLTLGAATPIHRGILLLQAPKTRQNLPTCHTCVTMCKHIGTGTKNHPPATNRWVPTVLGIFANSFTLFLANHFLSPSVPAPWPYVWSAWPCHPCLKNSPAVTQLIGEKKREENRRKAEKCWNVSSRHISNPSPLVHSGRMQLRAQAKMESGESGESGWVKKECHNEGGWLWMSSWLQCSEKAEIFSFLQLGSTRNLAHARHAGRAQAQTARSLSGSKPLTGLTEQEKNAPTIIICHRTHWEFCLTDSPDTYKYNRNTEYFDHKSWWSYHICAIYFRRLHWFLWFLCVCLSYPLVIKRWSGLWCSQTWLELLRNDEENAMLGLAKSCKVNRSEVGSDIWNWSESPVIADSDVHLRCSCHSRNIDSFGCTTMRWCITDVHDRIKILLKSFQKSRSK